MTAPPYEPPPLPPINDPYPFDPYPTDGDNTGDGGGGYPTPAPTPDFGTCTNLLSTQPDGCSRSLVQGGLQTPTAILPSSLATLRDEEQLVMSAQFQTALRRALDALNECYADVAISPFDCEQDLLGAFGAGSELQRLGRRLDSWSYSLGLAELGTSLVAARLLRSAAPWIETLNAGVGIVSISFSGTGQVLASLNAFNGALYKARLHTSCRLWLGAWDLAHCQ